MQADTAPGNVFVDTNYVDGVFHTLTVWDKRSSMTKFMVSGAHAKAMKIVGEIAYDTKVYGYESTDIPSWDEAHKLWHEKATAHGRRTRPVITQKDHEKQTLLSSVGLDGRQIVSVLLFLVATIVWSGHVSLSNKIY